MNTGNPGPPDREAELFHSALELAPGAARERFLRHACGLDSALRERVAKLLSVHEAATGFIPAREATTGAPTQVDLIPKEGPGTIIGRYKLRERLGEGGWGVVYVAEQETPVRRKVALKVIKPGTDTRSVIARFEAERQALAMMDHPNIAKVFDAGATESGRPYFVMELVRGERITDYCDQYQLTTTQRLELFSQVCAAVQHAHQKGIIHRDLKPSNILVTRQDGLPVPKVIDFGIAKATEGRLTEGTVYTELFQFLGTPAYMSPEQAEMSVLDIDTRSDIYSLGVVLYELLTGRVPFDPKELAKAGLDEIRRRIREEEPVRPSTRLSKLLPDDLTALARRRKVDAPKLLSAVRGELDWIIMKCLEKDRGRRYETATGLAQDVARYLNHEPVTAAAPGALYKVRKFARRHRAGLAVAATITVLLVAGVVVSSWQAVRATRAEREQAVLRAKAEKAQAIEAGLRKETAETLNQVELQKVEALFKEGESATAVAYLAWLLRQNPANELAAGRLFFALSQRNFALPGGEPLTHGDAVIAVAFSPDGEQVVTGSLDQTSRVWSARTGQALTPPLSHEGRVWSAGFSPDGKRILAAGDTAVRIWDVKTGQPASEWLRHDVSGMSESTEFSPDGQLVVTFSTSKRTARVWDANTGQQLTEIKHADELWSAHFSPDSSRVVTASHDKTARVWNARTGQALTPPLPHEGKVWSARFSPDGKKIVTACWGMDARLWDAQTGAPLGQPLKHEDGVLSARFSPDGQRVVTASRDHTVRIWDAKLCQPLLAPLQHEDIVMSAEFSQDGQRVLTRTVEATTRIWNVTTGRLVVEPIKLVGARVNSTGFSPDGRRVVTAHSDHTARIWEFRAGQMANEPFDARYDIGPGFSHDGRRILTVTQSKAVQIRDVNTGRLLAGQINQAGKVDSAEFSPEGYQVLTVSETHEARVWNATNGQPLIMPFGHESPTLSARFSPDSRFVVTTHTDKTARIWEAQTGRLVTGGIHHEGEINSTEFSRDGRYLVTTSRDHTARIWDTTTGQPLTGPLEHWGSLEGGNLESAAFSPDGQRVLSRAYSAVRLWDARSGRLVSELLKSGETYVRSAEFSADGQRVLTAAGDTAMVWDAQTGRRLAQPLKHQGGVYTARFSPDGRGIVTASADRTARIWDAATGLPRTEPLKHESDVSSATFSPDGRRVVTASDDKTARVWDANTGLPLTEPLGHRGLVRRAYFSPDGERVVTMSWDGSMLIWATPAVLLPTPEWVPDLAEAIAVSRLNDRRLLEPAPSGQWEALKQRITSSTAHDPWTRWARWYLSDPNTRTISAFTSTTVPEYVQRRLNDKGLEQPPNYTLPREDLPQWINAQTLDRLQEAVSLMPTNGLVLARLTRAVLAQSAAENPRQVGEAAWLSERAVGFAPNEWEAWWARAEALERANDSTAALAATESAVKLLQPPDPEFWLARGQLLEKAGRPDDAYQSLTRAIELAGTLSGPANPRLSKSYLARSGLMQRQNRPSEARADFLKGKGIPTRDPAMPARLIDLNFFYNSGLTDTEIPGSGAGDLAALAPGLQIFAGVQFDVRGVIQAGPAEESGGVYPGAVTNIPVRQTSRRLHFLHAAAFSKDTPDGTRIGHYLVRYADGTQVEIPIIIGETVGDWLHLGPHEGEKKFTVAWAVRNEVSGRPNRLIRLFQTAWENPRPGKAIQTIDLAGTSHSAHPFLVALTAEP